MRTLLAVIVMLTLAGCGDTVYQSAPGAPESVAPLKITSTLFKNYSTHTPLVTVNGVVTQWQSQYFMQGVIGYEGDPEGATLSLFGKSLIFYPNLTMVAGNRLFFSMSKTKEEMDALECWYVAVLTNRKGADSSSMPMFNPRCPDQDPPQWVWYFKP